MAENEVKIGHLYYPNPLRSDSNARTAQRIGPTRFSRNGGPCGPCYFRDHAKIGIWSPGEIAQSFQPAPDLGARFAPKGTAPGAGPVSVVVQATEGVIACESAGYRNTYFPADFFAAFEPYREAPIVRIQAGDPVRFRSDASFRAGMTSAAAHARAPREGWLAFEAFTLDPRAPDVYGGRDVRIKHPTYCPGDHFWVCTNRLEAVPAVRTYEVRDLRVQFGGVDFPSLPHYGSIGRSPAPTPAVGYRANVLDAIEDFADRDGGEEFLAAMNVSRAISDLIRAERGRGPTLADRDLRAPLEKAINAFDNRSEECPLLEADPVIKALDALIAACRAAR